MIHNITPVILTYNEAPNIGRTLSKLLWARRVVIVDSGSTDDTAQIVKQFINAEIYSRSFDTHAQQWNYAVQNCQIDTEWVLAMDADNVLTEEFIGELKSLKPSNDVVAYKASFCYRLGGKNLRGSIYPPVTVLYRKNLSHYEQDGHTQRLVTGGGRVEELSSKIIHDDQKPFERWLASQKKYMELEPNKLKKAPLGTLNFPDKIRKVPFVAPFLTAIYCLFIRGLILDGKQGLFYTYQRFLSEWLLSKNMVKQ